MQILSIAVFVVQNIKSITSVDAQIHLRELQSKAALIKGERKCLSLQKK